MAAALRMKDLIEFLAKSLVDDPEAVSVHSTDRDQTTFLDLEVAQEDLGKVIGRQGRTARAIRTLLAAAGQKTRRRYILDIVD
ncbi:MAG TPA: KH domain-containing protein [Thermoanaerobaculia bacterium]|nr:KH domain-containing protein [Thermoanaerobaculia bacterium]